MTRQLDHYRLLGRSGLRVSPLTLGTMTFAADGWGSSDEEASRMVDLYVDRGGNVIDTANFYGGIGGSESLLARLIHGRRQRLVISTKYSMSTCSGDPNAAGNHRKNMVRSVEDSLRRLKTDYIDLYYLHMWDFRTPPDEIMRAFDDLVRAGKILYVGISDTPAWQVAWMQCLADQRGWTPFCALQISYSLIERTVERELIPMADQLGLGICPWSPLGGGVLSGKYSLSDLAPLTGRMTSRKAINAATGRLSEHNLAIAGVVKEIADEIGCTSPQVALAWALLDPAIISPVVGARTSAQLEDNLDALSVVLSSDQVDRLDAASSVPLGFPHEMLAAPTNRQAFGDVTVEQRRSHSGWR